MVRARLILMPGLLGALCLSACGNDADPSPPAPAVAVAVAEPETPSPTLTPSAPAGRRSLAFGDTFAFDGVLVAVHEPGEPYDDPAVNPGSTFTDFIVDLHAKNGAWPGLRHPEAYRMWRLVAADGRVLSDRIRAKALTDPAFGPHLDQGEKQRYHMTAVITSTRLAGSAIRLRDPAGDTLAVWS